MAGYKEMKTNPNLQRRAIPGKPGATALNLITQEIPKNRSCAQAGLQESACVCSEWRSVQPARYNKSGNFFELVMGEALDFINEQREITNGSCLTLTKDESTIVKAAEKAPTKVGYSSERASTQSQVLHVEFKSAWNTKWRVVGSINLVTKHTKLLEVIPLHRFNKRKVCWDGASPLRYCACNLETR